MKDPAGCRIARVRMKNGGADVHVLERKPEPHPCRGFVRNWTTSILGRKRPPDAVMMIAWWKSDEPGALRRDISLRTESDAFPLMLLPDLAKATAADYLSNWNAVNAVRRNFGYDPAEDDGGC